MFFIWLLRCQDAEAFELSSSGFTNGVFVKFLKKRLLDDEKITVVLDRVAEGERKRNIINKSCATLQILYVRYAMIRVFAVVLFSLCDVKSQKL